MGQGLTRRRFVETAGAALAAAYALGPARSAQAAGQASYAVPGWRRRARSSSTAGAFRTSTPASQPTRSCLQGFNAARDRLWQIDLWRKRGLGRLSAAFGRAYVEQDRAARLFLYRGDMEREWVAYGDDAEAIADAFAAGVNAYVEPIERGRAPLPVEFQALGYRPARWAAEDVVRIRSHGLSRNVADQVDRGARCLRRPASQGRRAAKQLEPADARGPRGARPLRHPGRSARRLRAGDRARRASPSRKAGMAARAARRSATCGRGLEQLGDRAAAHRDRPADPRQRSAPRARLPSLRYIVHLVAPGLDVIGAGEPALPGISIGHNGTIAFGLTIFAIDQEDLYVYETRRATRRSTLRRRLGADDGRRGDDPGQGRGARARRRCASPATAR